MYSEKCLWRNILLFIGIFHSTQTASLRCYKETLDDAEVFQLNAPEPLLNSTCFNKTLPTIVHTFGYRGKVAGTATTTVISTYLAAKDRNVILLDWEKEAAQGILGLEITYAVSAVPNAKIVGNDFGEALTKLERAGLDLTRVHLLGHSLGAHLMGYAGKRARENGYVVARITGLDPARALFEGLLGVYSGLDSTCALFVDVIHTDPGGYGLNSSIGTADFWPNYGDFTDGDGTQPGCPTGNFEKFSTEDLCNHDRCWQLYVESVQNPTAFPAAAEPDYNSWVESDGQSTQIENMGESVDTSAKGNYYLNTGSTSPYSLGANGVSPA